MNLQSAYASAFVVTLTASMSSVLLGGELPPFAWFALATPLLAARTIVGSAANARPLFGTLLALGGFVWGATTILVQGLSSLLLGAALALLAALAGRLVSRANLDHDLQALLISLLLVFAGAGLHTQVTYGLSFVIYAVFAAWALALRQLWLGAKREAERPGGALEVVTLARRDVVTPSFFGLTGMAAVLILFATSVVFVLFPRVGLGSLSLLRERKSTLPDGVTLSGPSRGSAAGDEVVARISGLDYATFSDGLYLRIATYDLLARSGFVRGASTGVELPLAEAKTEAQYEVFLQPVGDRELATLGSVDSAQVIASGTAGPLGARLVRAGPAGRLWSMGPLDGPIRYRVVGRIARAREGDGPATPDTATLPGVMAAYLTLPSGLDPRIQPLAQRLTSGATSSAAKAARLRNYLRDGFAYSLEQSNGVQSDPLASFLFDDRRGHCEYFATAYAVLLRASGVPARVAGGFAGGLWDASDDVAVFTTSTAHAWVEWYEPGHGWVTDDATPVAAAAPSLLVGWRALTDRVARAWDERVLDYGLEDQLALVRRAMSGLGPRPAATKLPWRSLGAALGGVVAMVALTLLLRRRKRVAPGDAVQKALVRALGGVHARLRGAPVSEAQTLRAALEPLDLGETRALVLSVLSAYEALAFAGRVPERRVVRQWIRELGALRGPSRRRS